MIDLSTILGLLFAGVMLYVGLDLANEGSLYYDPQALVIVLGGTIIATFINVPFKFFPKLLMTFIRLFFEQKLESTEKTIKKIVKFSELAITNGFESLVDTDEYKAADPFTKKGLAMLSDGRSEAFIREVLESQITETKVRHRLISDTFVIMGSFAPTFGLLGTVVGIVKVLKYVTDAASVGSSMALALLTTFYGIAFANFLFIPMSGKLRIRGSLEYTSKQMIVEGIISIHQGLLPIMVEQRLKSYLKDSKAV